MKLWAEAGLGVRWGFRGEKTLSHVVWADNVWIFATSASMYQSMINIFTLRLERAKMRWKPKSLERMVIGTGASGTDDTPTLAIHAPSPDITEELDFKEVDQ